MIRLKIHVRGQAARRLGMQGAVFAHMQESFVNNASMVGWYAISKKASTNLTGSVPRTIFCIHDERPFVSNFNASLRGSFPRFFK